MTKDNLAIATYYIGKSVRIKIDRPIGSRHPKWGFTYEVNYGYVPETVSGNNEELDVYLLGVDKPIRETVGKCIAVIHRSDDNDDKLVVIPKKMVNITDSEIKKQTYFQEQFFQSTIIRERYGAGSK